VDQEIDGNHFHAKKMGIAGREPIPKIDFAAEWREEGEPRLREPSLMRSESDVSESILSFQS
jgi:hypothetical protein